jgi:hypothetical protein
MPTPPLSDEAVRAAADLLKAHNGNVTHAAKAAGLDRGTFRGRLKHAAERGFLGTKPVLPGFRISQTTAFQTDGVTTREVIQQRPEPGPVFEMPEGMRYTGVSAYTDGEDRVIGKWHLGRLVKDEGADVVAAIKEAFGEYRGRAQLVPPPASCDADLMSIYPIGDAHHGLMAWGKETGEAYDLKIGKERLETTAAALIAQSPPSRRALILNLGDWTHQDSNKNMTPASGNILEVDGRYFKVVLTGVHLMRYLIDLALAKHDEVEVRNNPGNHDPHASVALTIALAMFYENNPRVRIDESPDEWFFRRFGQNLIGSHHGHRCKPQEMAMAMAERCREDWGVTAFRHFYFGHIHHETAKEVMGVRVESFQTLAAKDAHAHNTGYSSGQSLTSITLHAEQGEVGRHRVNIAPARRAAA